MDFNLTGVWGMLKTPSVGFILFIMFLLAIFKIKDIYNIFVLFRKSKFNNLKLLKKEITELKGSDCSEMKLINSMLEMEVYNLTLGLSNKKLIPIFSYLFNSLESNDLFCFRKCVNFIKFDNLVVNESLVSSKRLAGRVAATALFLYFTYMLVFMDAELLEIKWFYITLCILITPIFLWYFNKLPTNSEMKKVTEILKNIDDIKFNEYKLKYFSDYVDKGTSLNEREVPTENLNQ
ncbi:TPA: hypothetical protein ACS78C_000288 [Providencia alcalifaciens]